MEQQRGTTIQEFYRGSNILITGGTGFMGKVLLEKLLRSCPNLSNIFLLVRSKKGKDTETRVTEIVQCPLFDRLRREQPDFRQKIVVLEGDTSQPNLGLSPGDRHYLVQNVDIVFHLAATVRFDEKLQTAVAINVVGTRNVMQLCTACANLKVVVHASTAYTRCELDLIDEQFHEPPLKADKIIQLVDSLDDTTMARVSSMLLENWPNSYAFTKAIGEDVVRDYWQSLPVGIFRPTIVCPTYSEPAPGWIDNLHGTMGGVMGIGVGVVRAVQMSYTARADLVPCDMAINAMIAMAWDIHSRRRSGEDHQVPIYNFVSSCDNPITWGRYLDYVMKYVWEFPYKKAMWHPFTVHAKNRTLYNFYVTVFHRLPALMLDTVLFCIGRSPKMSKMYRKLHYYMDHTSKFRCEEWDFANPNTVQMWGKMDRGDQQVFNFDVKTLDWDQYFKDCIIGIRSYLVKEDLGTLPEATSKRNRLYLYHQIAKYSLAGLFVWQCYNTNLVLQWTEGNPYVLKMAQCVNGAISELKGMFLHRSQ